MPCYSLQPPADPWGPGAILNPEDTLELLRDRLNQGMDLMESLTVTERTLATAHIGLQAGSYDMHVKLGMEVGVLPASAHTMEPHYASIRYSASPPGRFPAP